ncbi:MAG: hypothetical protein H0V66_09780 [Bdellovibrionales bacterium]|nr:hypothetical protein [Bdellovibrionales bacterium]
MKSLSTILLMSSMTLASVAMADVKPGLLGPITHERTDTPKKVNANVGRFLYVGTAPKFDVGEVDLTVSKMSLTVRANGWMTQAKVDGYASQLYKRWEQIEATLQDPSFVLHPLVKFQNIATKDTSIAWAKIAAQYSSHVLENRGVEIFNPKRNAKALQAAGIEDEYRRNVSTAILRYFFNDNSLTSDSVKADNMLRDNLISVSNSQKLFQKHYGHIFTNSSTKPGYLGHLTLVYPIAATVEGPMDQPAEGVRSLMSYGTIEARWWSDKWDDEFGGLPFILINAAGVAFHGPITNFAPLDVWFLRRGYVSHGCHRMDSSDIIELRNILPRKMADLGKVKLTILNNFDVTDWNNDGQKEVVDVKYYNIPSAIAIPKGKTIDDAIKPFLVETQMKTYYSTHAYAKKYYDAVTDTITGTPKYKISGGVLVKDGVHPALPLKRFDYQPSRVLQYKELGTQMYPYDDNQGKYPPTYFLKN